LRRLWLVLVCAVGCYDPTLSERQFTCSLVDTRCPAGFTCDPCSLYCVKSIHACHDGFSFEMHVPSNDLGTDGFATPDQGSQADQGSQPDLATAVDLPPGCCTAIGCDVPDDKFVDENCDGIDGDIRDAVFVDPVNGNDSTGTGAINQPLQHLNGAAGALAVALAQMKHQILIGQGSIQETGRIVIANGISLYGGYDPSSAWLRSDAVPRPLIGVTGDNVGVAATGLTVATHWDRVNLQGPTAFTYYNGISAYGLWVQDSGAFLTVSNSSISSDQGGDGGNSTTPGPPSTPLSAIGQPGVGSCYCNTCTLCTRGAGGTIACAYGGAYGGGAGGDCIGNAGLAGDGPGGPGTGGAAGMNGPNGADGTAATGVAASFGSVDALGYHPSVGKTGSNGFGGSGGGGGLGQSISSCTYGVSGPGGGAGACGGAAATAASGGGGSFGAFLWNSSPTLNGVKLTSGTGGSGGNGALGGPSGAAGGGGGSGAGNGGGGGAGGASGGGSGGPSICLEIAGGSSPTIVNPLYVNGGGGAGGRGAGTAPAGPQGPTATTRTD
jgi:hypothetical protein